MNGPKTIKGPRVRVAADRSAWLRNMRRNRPKLAAQKAELWKRIAQRKPPERAP